MEQRKTHRNSAESSQETPTNEILRLLESDGRLTAKQISAMCDTDSDSVQDKIKEFEDDGVILGYQALIDWDKTNREYVSALIELKVAPQPDRGFDRIAEKLYNYPEVKSLYLMSGSFDIAIIIEGKTMKEVAFFVAQKIATLESVVSTATHFVLQKYKDKGVVYGVSEKDERGNFPI